jgi:hypothetical protein
LRAIEAGLDDARASGTRAAVCLADLALAETLPASPDTLDAADAWLLHRLRDGDRLYRVGSTLVVVASGLDHPRAGEQLAERVRALPAGGGAPIVGLAIYPVHGDDAVTLRPRARSARRDRLQRAAAGRRAHVLTRPDPGHDARPPSAPTRRACGCRCSARWR